MVKKEERNVDAKKIEIYPTEEVSLSINPRQMAIIQEETPKEVLKSRKGRGGLEFVYIETNWVIKKMNEVFGLGWDFEILEQTPIELALKIGQIVVKGKLTIKDKYNRTASKTQFGSAELKFIKGKPRTSENLVDIADDYKSAASDALKKCASYFGIALDVYSGEFTPEDLKEPEVREEPIVEQKQQKNLTTEQEKWQPTDKQIRLIWSLASKNKISEEQVHKIIKEAWGYNVLKDIESLERFNELLDFIDPEGIEEREKIRKNFKNSKGDK